MIHRSNGVESALAFLLPRVQQVTAVGHACRILITNRSSLSDLCLVRIHINPEKFSESYSSSCPSHEIICKNFQPKEIQPSLPQHCLVFIVGLPHISYLNGISKCTKVWMLAQLYDCITAIAIIVDWRQLLRCRHSQLHGLDSFIVLQDQLQSGSNIVHFEKNKSWEGSQPSLLSIRIL